jgi:pimeloyl-ACP methyl ester carboxylesterase
MKTVLFVPGFKEGLTDRNYKAVLKVIESKGYKAVFVPMQWKRTTITDWEAELAKVYEKYEPKNTILAGFSYGAMTALVAASKRVPAGLWLFSLSPYFSEDIPFLKLAWLRAIGKQRQERFWRLSFDELYPKVVCPVKLFAGSKELQKWPDMARRAEDAAQKFKNCTYTVVENVGHNIEHPLYIQAIKEQV